MTTTQRKVLALFLSGLTLVVLGYAVWDVYLATTAPDAVNTISWSMALLGAKSPFLVFVIGHVTGGILWGLAAHFWAQQPTPAMWADYEKALRHNAILADIVDYERSPAGRANAIKEADRADSQNSPQA